MITNIVINIQIQAAKTIPATTTYTRTKALSSAGLYTRTNVKKKEINKKMSGNFGYMGSSNPCGDLDQMSLVGRYGGHNHVCNIW